MAEVARITADKMHIGPDGPDGSRTHWSGEKLSNLPLIDGSVEAISADGLRIRPGDQRLWEAVDRLLRGFDISKIKEKEIEAGETTALVVVSAKELKLSKTSGPRKDNFLKSLFRGRQQSESEESDIEQEGSQIEYKDTDMALIFTFRVREATADGRDTQLMAIAVLPEENLMTTLEELVKNPEFLFTIAQTINGGSPISKFDGTQADVVRGDSIKFTLGNSAARMAGKSQIPSKSNPFASR